MYGKWLTLTAALLIGLNFTGCKKSDSASSTGASASTKIKMVYIPKNTGNPYFEPAIDGFKKAAEELGADFHSTAPATADATSQLQIIEDQVQEGVNVLAITPNSPDALNAALSHAMSKGIIVICSDSDLTGNESNRNAAILPSEPTLVAKGQVELLGSLIDYKGKFAILSSTTDAPNQNTWIAIMKDTLKNDAKYKDMQLVDVVYGNDEPQKSLTEAEALLTKYPDLRGIIAPTTVGVAACAQAVETAKKADQVAVTGLGTPDQMRRFIKNGTVKAFALWSPFDEGYCAGQAGIQIAQKKLEAKPGATFTAGTLGQRTLGDKNVIIVGPPVIFTKDNIDQFHF
ncbi:MAG TPA: rhamnose ABC transporter substrate-binding protein [Tepidisphaeraceae bacterium]|jgi:rhamnose transport system substrate-binding protein|nr:rhamnose ABC transporter substrate-binding protein [Tepidisphaeraceae bacterium]